MGTKWQPKSVRRGLEKSIRSDSEVLDEDLNPLAKREISDYDEQVKRLDADKDRLNQMTPPEFADADARGECEARSKQLMMAMRDGSESAGIPPMPSVGQMKDNPDYSTNQHMTWERAWKRNNVSESGHLVKVDPAKGEQGAIMEWKDTMYRLNKEAEEEGMAFAVGSIENFRPGNRVPLADQHVPVSFALTQGRGRGNYDKIFPDHKPLKSEVQAGTYFEACLGTQSDGSLCGEPVEDKHNPWCSSHEDQFTVAAAG